MGNGEENEGPLQCLASPESIYKNLDNAFQSEENLEKRYMFKYKWFASLCISIYSFLFLFLIALFCLSDSFPNRWTRLKESMELIMASKKRLGSELIWWFVAFPTVD